MKIELTDKTISIIARKVAEIIREEDERRGEEYISTKEAAEILHISTDRLRHLKDKFPHIKVGSSEQGRILFRKKGLIEKYTE